MLSCTSGCWGVKKSTTRPKGNLKHLRVATSIALVQKSALLVSAKTLRKVLKMWRKDAADLDWFPLATCCCSASMYDFMSYVF